MNKLIQLAIIGCSMGLAGAAFGGQGVAPTTSDQMTVTAYRIETVAMHTPAQPVLAPINLDITIDASAMMRELRSSLAKTLMLNQEFLAEAHRLAAQGTS